MQYAGLARYSTIIDLCPGDEIPVIDSNDARGERVSGNGEPAEPPFGAVVLAGERPGGSPLARQLGLKAGILAPVAGRAAVVRVLEALKNSNWIGRIVLCGPAPGAINENPPLKELLASPEVSYLAPKSGPAASALAALKSLDHWPALLTSGDHALLNRQILHQFCSEARAADADAVVGLVPWRVVRTAFPHSRRTVLKFADEPSCGSNLILVLNPSGLKAVAYWQRAEALRKRPWRIARQLGWRPLIRYLTGQLTRDEAVAVLSARAGCRVRWVNIEAARAALDIDSLADLKLANELLAGAPRDALS